MEKPTLEQFEKNFPEKSQMLQIEVIENIPGRKVPRQMMIFDDMTSLTEQHTADHGDVNLLMKRFSPSELDLYLQARDRQRQPITNHDFSREPSLQDAKNEIYKMEQAFLMLPEDIKTKFKSFVDFLKFADNPANQKKLVDMGILEEVKPVVQEPTTNQILSDIKSALTKDKNDDDQTTTKKSKKADPS